MKKQIYVLMSFFAIFIIPMTAQNKKTLNTNNDLFKSKKTYDGYIACSASNILPYYEVEQDGQLLKFAIEDLQVKTIFYERLELNELCITTNVTKVRELKDLFSNIEFKKENGYAFICNYNDYVIGLSTMLTSSAPSDEDVVTFICRRF